METAAALHALLNAGWAEVNLTCEEADALAEVLDTFASMAEFIPARVALAPIARQVADSMMAAHAECDQYGDDHYQAHRPQ